MEFYLLEHLDFHLVIFHPYRDLIDLCAQYTTVEIGEEGEVGAEVELLDKDRYWGTGRGKWNIAEGAVQTAWYALSRFPPMFALLPFLPGSLSTTPFGPIFALSIHLISSLPRLSSSHA